MNTLTCSGCNETKLTAAFFVVDKVNGIYTKKCLSCLFPIYEYAPSKPKRAYKKRAQKPVDEVVIAQKEKVAKPPRKPVEYIPATPQAGYVYLLSSSVGLYKIGMSRDVSKRMGEFDRTIPIETKCLHYIKTENRRAAEKYLHEKFAERRVKYEWFDLSSEQVDWILSLGEIDSLFDVRNRSET